MTSGSTTPPPTTKSPPKNSFFPYPDKPNQYRSNVPPYTPPPRTLLWYIKFLTGVACTTNFLIFWALPIFGQGQLWKQLLVHILRPIYNLTEKNYYLRSFAEKYIYNNPRHADYAASVFYLVLSISASLGYVFYYQLRYGDLPAWLIAVYFLAWVGFGGRTMGGAYTFAHKEGHDGFFYKPGFRSTIGNFFENIVGPFFGNIPYNFTTSHIAIHHKLNGGKGDTFYQWDCDRTSWRDLMVYQTRILMHTTGISSLAFFAAKENKKFFRLLSKGMFIYYIIYPALIYAITRSPKFLFFIYFQPMFCMTYFLAFMNFAFHAFIEFDSEGKHILPVSSTMIIDGDDDSFGEDDHMTHHISVRTYWKDLPVYQQQHASEYAACHASIFRGMSIVEMSILLLIKQWDLLADRYVDYSQSLTKEQIKSMLQIRATAIEPQEGKNYAIVIPDEEEQNNTEKNE